MKEGSLSLRWGSQLCNSAGKAVCARILARFRVIPLKIARCGFSCACEVTSSEAEMSPTLTVQINRFQRLSACTF